MSVCSNIKDIRSKLPQNVKLVCVSKFHPDEAIQQAYNCGERIFGESKVQEMAGKFERLPKDIQWHFIGHLQTNKVKYLASFVALIHGVDSSKLLEEINKQAEKQGRKIKCLLQVHIADEETKFGFDEAEILKFVSGKTFSDLNNVIICGLMGMATFTDDKEQIKSEFETLKSIFNRLKSGVFKDSPEFSELSMGMSDDYPIAVECGSTMVRIGSSIFGSRYV